MADLAGQVREATGLDPRDYPAEHDYLEKCVRKINAMDEDDWEQLPDDVKRDLVRNRAALPGWALPLAQSIAADQAVAV